MKSEKIGLNQIHLHVYHIGQGTETLIWTHGLMGCAQGEIEYYRDFFEAMSKEFNIILFDARGHGESDDDISTENHHYENLADDMLTLAEYYRLNEFYLGGSSKGAATALWAAKKSPEKIKGLILNLLPDAWQWREQTHKNHLKIIETIQHMGLEAFCAELKRAPLPVAMQGQEAKRDIDVEALRQHPQDDVLAILKGAANSDLPAVTDLTQLNIATHLFSLENMPGHHVEVASHLSEHLSNCSLHHATSQQDLLQKLSHIIEEIC